jgi:hypothetical protein
MENGAYMEVRASSRIEEYVNVGCMRQFRRTVLAAAGCRLPEVCLRSSGPTGAVCVVVAR